MGQCSGGWGWGAESLKGIKIQTSTLNGKQLHRRKCKLFVVGWAINPLLLV